MELDRGIAEQIVVRILRNCEACKARLQPTSTICVNILPTGQRCGHDNPLEKIALNSFYEHFEIKKCDKHDSCLHYCVHPAQDSKLEELVTWCSRCALELLDKAKAPAK